MKKCLSPNELLELSEAQKNALRNFWQPCKYDLAIELVWKDVENDICDGVVIMVADARAIANPHRYCELILKVWYPDGLPDYECLDNRSGEEENESENGDGGEDDYGDPGETSETGENELVNAIQDGAFEDHFLDKENCLPLLTIGQMMEILNQHKGAPNISFTPDEVICYVNGEEYSGEELADVLWEALKTLL
jgi:hypothetical protein